MQYNIIKQLSPCAGDGLDDFLAPDTDEDEGLHSRAATAKPFRAELSRPRSTREKLGWSDSSASEGQDGAKLNSGTKRELQQEDEVDHAAVSQNAEMGGTDQLLDQRSCDQSPHEEADCSSL